MPVDYAKVSAKPTPADEKWFIGLMSLCVGICSLIIFGGILLADIRELWRLNTGLGKLSGFAWSEYHFRHEFAGHGAALCVIGLSLASLLIAGGAMLWRGDSRGLTLHWVYAWLQLFTAIVSMFTVKSDLDLSQLGIFSILVAITAGLIMALYPVVILITLSEVLVQEETNVPIDYAKDFETIDLSIPSFVASDPTERHKGHVPHGHPCVIPAGPQAQGDVVSLRTTEATQNAEIRDGTGGDPFMTPQNTSV